MPAKNKIGDKFIICYDAIILNLILLNDSKTYIYSPDKAWHEFLEKALDFKFEDDVIDTDRYLLCKELTYMLKKAK